MNPPSRSPSPRAGLDEEARRAALRQAGSALRGDFGSSASSAFALLAAAERSSENALPALAAKSDVRLRRVALAGPWWRGDSGALVGFLEPTGEAVALLPQGGGRGYRLCRYDGGEEAVSYRSPLRPHAYALSPAWRPEVSFSEAVSAMFGDRLHAWFALIGWSTACGVLAVLPVIFLGIVFRGIIPSGEFGWLLQAGALLACASWVKALLDFGRRVAAGRLRDRAEAILLPALWDRVLKMPVSFFRRLACGNLASRILGSSALPERLVEAAASAAFGLPVAVLSCVLLFIYGGALALVALACALLILAAAILLDFRAFLTAQGTAKPDHLPGLTFQLISALARIRLAGAEGLAFSAWIRRFVEREGTRFAASRWTAIEVLLWPSAAAALVLLLALAGPRYTPFRAADLIAFGAALGTLLAGLGQLRQTAREGLSALAHREDLRPLLEAPLESSPQRQPPGRLTGLVEARHLRFRYADDAPWILDGLSLRVEPGEFVALVGASGCGKSSLLRLLLGFDAPAAGMIRYDGLDLQALDLAAVRQQIGAVLQRFGVIPGTVFQNIAGDAPLAIDEAWEAARLAGLAEEIRALPMQMHTLINESGSGFSAGQRQRLALARALARRPRLLILDEATSALDNHSQAVITASLGRLGITRLIVAHRLSTIAGADRILLLHEGRIVEEGSYASLVRAGGLFQSLTARQIFVA